MASRLTRFALTLAVALLAVRTGHTATETPTPAVGSPAPAFTLQDQSGKSVSLADQKGKWVVLYFYPKDFTPGCTTQACGFRDDIFAFRKANEIGRAHV